MLDVMSQIWIVHVNLNTGYFTLYKTEEYVDEKWFIVFGSDLDGLMLTGIIFRGNALLQHET